MDKTLKEHSWVSFQDEQPNVGELVDLICVIDDCNNCPDFTEDTHGHHQGIYESRDSVLDTHWRRQNDG